MLRPLAVGMVGTVLALPAGARPVADGLFEGTVGTGRRLVAVSLLADPPPRSGRARELWIFRHTQRGPWDGLIADAAEREGLDPFLLKGLLENESRLDPGLIGKRRFAVVGGRRRVISGGARGIAQLTSAGVEAVNELRQRRGDPDPFTARDAMRPERAIPAAASLLSDYVARFGRDGGVTAYNTGPSGGRLVREVGFARALRDARLHRTGVVLHQGARFLPNVLMRTNRLREACGLERVPAIGAAPTRRPTS